MKIQLGLETGESWAGELAETALIDLCIFYGEDGAIDGLMERNGGSPGGFREGRGVPTGYL